MFFLPRCRVVKYFAFIFIATFPFSALAGIFFSEIAWMGTPESQYGEWIELYNDSSVNINLGGYKIYEEGGKVLLGELTGSILANGFYVLERATPSVPDPLPGVSGQLLSFGGGGLKNSGEFLILKSQDDLLLDSINFSSGWPAGDSETKQTMQKISGNWMTATATPGALNVYTKPANIKEAEQIDNTKESKSNNKDSQKGAISAHSSGVALSNFKPESSFSLSAGRDRIAAVNSPVVFEAFLFDGKKSINGEKFFWNFGDGYYATGKIEDHYYDLPGEYNVTLNAQVENYTLVARSKVKVFEPKLSLDVLENKSQKYVSAENLEDYEINLGGWQIKSAGAEFTIPRDTIILPRGRVNFTAKVMGLSLSGGRDVSLVYPNGEIYKNFSNKDVNETQNKIVGNADNVTITQSVVTVSSSSNQNDAALEEMDKQISDIKNRLSAVSIKALTVSNSRSQTIASKEIVKEKEKETIAAPAVQAKSQQPKIIVIGETRKNNNLLNFLIRVPENSLNFIKNLIF